MAYFFFISPPLTQKNKKNKMRLCALCYEKSKIFSGLILCTPTLCLTHLFEKDNHVDDVGDTPDQTDASSKNHKERHL